MPVTVDADGAIQLMEDMGENSVDLSPVLAVIASDLLTFTDDRFQTGTDPTGQQWKPLSEATKKRRRKGPRAGRSDTVLVDTSVLRNSITAVPGVSAILIGTNSVYAGAHQFGNPANRFFGKTPAPIPARPYLPFSSATEVFDSGPSAELWEHFDNMIAHYIETGEILQR